MRKLVVCAAMLVLGLTALPGSGQEGVKHSSGRVLGKMPAITKPVMFDTPEADVILSALAPQTLQDLSYVMAVVHCVLAVIVILQELE